MIDIVVVLCGGAGERLWPASHPARPKPLIPFGDAFGGPTLLAATIERYRAVAERFLLVCGHDHAAAMAEAVPGAEVLVEPERRGTGPAVAVASLFAAEGADTVLVTPADHFVRDGDALRAAIRRGVPHAQAGELVTFGVVPDRPDTGFGYIGRGEALADGAYAVARFLEKPDRATAGRLVAEGCLWNSGLFLFTAEGLVAQLGRHAPGLLAGARAAAGSAARADGRWALDPDVFGRVPTGSFDVMLAERTTRGVVVPVDCGWSDVGSWEAVARLAPTGPDGPFVWTEDVSVRIDGLRGIGVVATPRGVRVFALPGEEGPIIPPEGTSGEG